MEKVELKPYTEAQTVLLAAYDRVLRQLYTFDIAPGEEGVYQEVDIDEQHKAIVSACMGSGLLEEICQIRDNFRVEMGLANLA